MVSALTQEYMGKSEERGIMRKINGIILITAFD